MMNVVMVPFHDYKKWEEEGFRTRDAHVCEHFSENSEIDKILVINRPTSLAEVMLKRKDWRTKNGKVEYCKNNAQLSKIKNNVWCLDIFLLDFIKVARQKKMWWFTSFNYDKVINAINEACAYLNIDDRILLLQNPMAVGAAKKLQAKSVVFDAIDNWLYHPQMPDKTVIMENYAFIDTRADLIMTVSQALLDTFPVNKNKHWIPNGVDLEYFKAAVKKQKDSKIIVGYVGKIQDRVDFDLVECCLKKFADVNFVFLGPVYSQKERVKKLQQKYKNISFKGDIHYKMLPEEMQCFDIAIIPHKVDEFTNSMNPLKLYEYLAAGKPVVTTGVAGTKAISTYVRSADNYDAFIHEVEELIHENKDIDPVEVINSVPQECTWTSRTDAMIELFKRL